MTILAVIGTRPEAIKMAPVVLELRRRGADVRFCTTGQHRDLVNPALASFGLVPDIDLSLMSEDQSPGDLAGRILTELSRHFFANRPKIVVVHGDTISGVAAAMAAYYAKVPIAHVEAGLRSGDVTSPWPEETNRCVISRLADWHFAPTRMARDALIAEGISSERVFTTGNTVVDALDLAVEKIDAADNRMAASNRIPMQPRTNRALLLVTLHRRESQGRRHVGICRALRRIAACGDVDIVLPMHPSPAVSRSVGNELHGRENIHVLPPLDYLTCVDLIRRARLVLTDSGGIQEEAATLGTPLLVLRDTTERQEIISAGTAKLVGYDPAKIERAVANELSTDGSEKPRRRSAIFGDDNASSRIADVLLAA